MKREQKEALVEEISSALGDAEAIFAIDYRGISVTQAAELRIRLAEADTTFRVVKNRLAKRAAERAGTDGLSELLEGPTALALVKGDPVTAAKAIATFGREHRLLDYKGGLMERAPLDPEQFKAIARLPGLDLLRGQLVGVAASPITGLARGLGAMLSGLAVGLGQIQERGLVGGEPEPQPDEGELAGAEDEAEGNADPAEPDAGASEEQDQSGESEHGGSAPSPPSGAPPAEDSTGDDSNEEE